MYGDEYTAWICEKSSLRLGVLKKPGLTKGFNKLYKKTNKACKANVTNKAIQNLLCAQIVTSR